MKKVQQGFTLIELMIVIAIIGILAAIALPQYQQYTQRTNFSEVLSIGQSYKTAVSLCFQTNSSLAPCDAGTNGVPAAADATDQLAGGMTVVNGLITMTGTTQAGGFTSVLEPAANAQGSALIWTQTGSCLTGGACRN